jgi:diketogulonate reductase-like aldo/keto reductase
LPVIGLGTSRVFDIGPDEADRAPRRDVLRLLFGAGGRVIDTSPMYGNAETVVGELLDDLGAQQLPFMATKVWTRGRDSGVTQMDASIAKLRKRPIDLIQIHNLVDWRTHLATLREWKEAGKVRYIGITHYTSSALDDLAAIVEAEKIDFVQCAYSISVRDAERRLLPVCADRGVATLINRPYERGGVFRRIGGRPLPPWAADFDCASWGQFFLKFILSHPAATCVIPGTSKPKHMSDNAGAGRGRLPDATQRARMAALWDDL